MGDVNDTFGLEVFQKLYNDKISKKEDVIILFIHWYLIKHGLKCIGVGDSKDFNAADKGSELLPEEWNTRPNYALRYLKNGKLYILHGTKSDENLLLNLLSIEDSNVSNIQFPINTIVNELHGPFETLIPSYQSMLQSVKKDLIDPVVPNTKKHVSTETAADLAAQGSKSKSDPISVQPQPALPQPIPHDPWRPAADPRNIGSSDLDPFRPGGGGMLFDPFGPGRNPLGPRVPSLGIPGRLPPGAVPPGARFDPFGPPEVNPRLPRRGDPDNDHLPPPGYDDMFM